MPLDDLVVMTRHLFTREAALRSLAGFALQYADGIKRTFILDPLNENTSLILIHNEDEDHRLTVFGHWIGKIYTLFNSRSVQGTPLEIVRLQAFRLHWHQFDELAGDRTIYGDLLRSQPLNNGQEYLSIETVYGPRLEDWGVLVRSVLSPGLAHRLLRIPFRVTPCVEDLSKVVPPDLSHPGMIKQGISEADFIEAMDEHRRITQSSLQPLFI